MDEYTLVNMFVAPLKTPMETFATLTASLREKLKSGPVTLSDLVRRSSVLLPVDRARFLKSLFDDSVYTILGVVSNLGHFILSCYS